MTGQTISHYRILDKLGEGGMGVVYKAEDTKLERTVALKFLAAHLLNDQEAKQRFLREAKSAAALHHPNICTVHEIDEVEGKTFLAMAFLEGEALDARIAKGPLPIQDALDIGRQVAEGLAAAHGKGIVHRDIKPANVMVDAKGRATILDFGLARLAEASKLTRADQTVGTMAYMSPEQIQGGEVGPRADVWALGCTLYEMIAGVRTFKGQYDQALAYEILNEEPEPLTGVRSGVPMELEFIVGKCLAKNPEDRYLSAADLIIDVRAILKRLDSGAASLVRRGVAVPSMPARGENRGSRELVWMAVAGLAVLIAAAALLWRPEPNAPEMVVLSIVAPSRVRMANAFPGPPVLSPDGEKLLFIGHESDGRSRIWIRPLDSAEAYPIEGTEEALMPFWSPDSRFVGFGEIGTEALHKVSIDAGSPRALAHAGAHVRSGAGWTDRGDLIVFADLFSARLLIVPGEGGKPMPVEVSGGLAGVRQPRFLPDGRHFLFYGRPESEGEAGLYIGTMPLDLSGSATVDTKRIAAGSDSTGWFAPGKDGHGHIFYMRGRTLLAQGFDPESLSVTDKPIVIADNVELGEYGDFSVSLDGKIAFRQSSTGAANLVWVDREGRTLEVVGKAEGYEGPELSPDGRYVAYDEGGKPYAMDLSRQVSTRLTDESVESSSLKWSPDGSRIVFRQGRPSRLVIKTPFSAESPETIDVEGVNGEPGDWGANGYIAYQAWINVNGRMDIRAIRVDSEGRPVGEDPLVLVDTPGLDEDSRFSPDGRWLAYSSTDSGSNQIYVQGFPNAGRRMQISVSGGVEPRWRGDGKELYYVAPDSGLMAVEMKVERGELQPGVPNRLFTLSERPLPFFLGNYDAANDGSRFIVVRPLDPPPPVTVILNWKSKFL